MSLKRSVFMGTPAFAAPSLRALAGLKGVEVPLVVTMPDRGRGRGRKPAPPAVKTTALDLGIEVTQPERLDEPWFADLLKGLAPDLVVVVAFGHILKPWLLDLPRFGALNVHASLLPLYRGPAPINWALIRGEEETGVSTMLLDAGVDSGPVLTRAVTPIGASETASQLHDRLSLMGAELLAQTAPGLLAGRITPRPQDHSQATYAPLLSKKDGHIDWTRPAAELDRLVRGLDPWPAAQAGYDGHLLKLFGSRLGEGRGAPGEFLGLDQEGLMEVAAREGSLLLAQAQPAGSRRMMARDFVNGWRLKPGARFSSPPVSPPR